MKTICALRGTCKDTIKNKKKLIKSDKIFVKSSKRTSPGVFFVTVAELAAANFRIMSIMKIVAIVVKMPLNSETRHVLRKLNIF